MSQDYQAVVVGAGPAGLAAGLAFAHFGVRAAVVGPLSNPNDGRTAALFQGSIEFLRRIGAWDAIKDSSEPLKAIRLIDATGGLLRAPEVTFWAHEIGLDAFGYNIPTGGLTVALEAVAAGKLTRIKSAGVASIAIEPDHARIVTGEGQTLTAALVAGADGRNSLAREAAGIDTERWVYPQAAVVATFAHSRDHHGISTELHRRSGPLTVVPMPGRASSLVWVETPEEAARLAQLSETDFNQALKAHVGGILGTMRAFSPRRVFPLSGQTAAVLGRNRVGLIGESGHIIPPIGAQGLNLSLRDGATLAELAADAVAAGKDPGAPDVLDTYEARRRRDVSARVWTIDLMNRSLLSEYLPIHWARGAGLLALKTVGPLRHLVMREGMTPSFATPRLMHP
ncbi:MAG TPA: UbiH/UbiF family hydroxylase [Hyphomicrobium sp.]|mgnify:CR=1 FL=1|nr:UbiH/UbiF family hydroxylase [Hyphomicrobium sp.]